MTATAGSSEHPAPPQEPRAAAEHPLDAHPARETSLHLLRMLETRMDAAGIALRGEAQLLLARLQLRLLAAAAMFIAVWGGIVLLAIALPPHLRVPVLSGLVTGFVVLAVAAQLRARRKASTHEVGSFSWFLDSLRQDLEVLSRALARPQPVSRGPDDGRARNDGRGEGEDRSARNDLAA